MIKTNARDIPVSDVLQSTNFSRSVYDKTAMESLKKSVADFGLLHPVGVSPSKEPGKFDLVYGYRRFIAYLELGKTMIPATVLSESPMSIDDRMRLNVIENNERKDVTMMESGLRWRKMIDSGDYTMKEISYIESVNEKKIEEVVSMYKNIPEKFLKNIVANDARADQSNLITQSKAHAIMSAAKQNGITVPIIADLFEAVRRNNISEKEILMTRKLVQAGYTVSEAVVQCRKATLASPARHSRSR